MQQVTDRSAPPSLHAMPARALLAAFLAMLLLALAATALVLREPWLGLTLAPGEGPAAPPRVVATTPELADTLGMALLHIQAGDGQGLALRSDDLLEEPDALDTYPQMAAFFARQERLVGLLRGEVRLILEGTDGRRELSLTPRPRPLSSLPAVYGFQLLVATLGCLLGVWVYLLRPADPGARMFALTGLCYPLFVLPAAVYGSRALALPGELFQALSSLNHFGALLFGCGLVALFLVYPRPLLRPRYLLLLPALFLPWAAADALRLAADQDWGYRLPVMFQMLAAIALGVVQWRRNRDDPVRRAALRWVALASSLGCGLFVFTTAGSQLLGWLPPLAQGYSFGFFLLMHGGLALGVGRYRLFDLDVWAYRILLGVGGAVAVVALDALLILSLRLDPGPALGLTLLAVGGLYLPLRHWLWHRLVASRRPGLDGLMPDIVAIAFQPTAAARAAGWRALLEGLYRPLRVHLRETGDEAVRLGGDGRHLDIPAWGELPGLRLEFRDQGRALFSPRDVGFVTALGELMHRSAAARDAFERGADEERRRIARDMHDDVGARLLLLMHRARDDEMADIARAAMQDLRTALASLEARARPLADALADWRHETAGRCETAGVELDWQAAGDLPELQLGARQVAALERVLREAVTNALKHGQPRRLTVRIGLVAQRLRLEVQDDGDRAASPDTWREGRGLRNMRRRLEELGGALELAAAGGVRLGAELPLG